jgi:hypothetical protein
MMRRWWAATSTLSGVWGRAAPTEIGRGDVYLWGWSGVAICKWGGHEYPFGRLGKGGSYRR